MDDQILIEAVDLHKSYEMLHGTVKVLTGLSLTISEGEHVCIMGASGTGKSTLMHLLAGLDTPDSGDVHIGGENINLWDESSRAEFRARNIGVVFQNYYLLPDLNVIENVLMPARALKSWNRQKKELTEKAKDRLASVGLAHRIEHRPLELSGGEQQRLAVARALINDPEILMADEPTGNLDKETGDRVLDDLFRLSSEHKRTLVIVTHDPHLAERCHRTVHLDQAAQD